MEGNIARIPDSRDILAAAGGIAAHKVHREEVGCIVPLALFSISINMTVASEDAADVAKVSQSHREKVTHTEREMQLTTRARRLDGWVRARLFVECLGGNCSHRLYARTFTGSRSSSRV